MSKPLPEEGKRLSINDPIRLEVRNKYNKESIRNLSSIYEGMKHRCYNPKNKRYSRYGGRGVTICQEWLNNKYVFIKWAIEAGWSKGLQIDKDIKGTGLLYGPEMCKIVTPEENRRNTSRTHKYSFRGELLIITDISKITGVTISVLRHRMHKLGMSMEEAVLYKSPMNPLEPTNRGIGSGHFKKPVLQYTLEGEFLAEYRSLDEASKMTGFHNTAIARGCKKWPRKACGYLWKFKFKNGVSILTSTQTDKTTTNDTNK